MEYKRSKCFFGNTGQDMKMYPLDKCYFTFTYPKTAAIINKIAVIFSVKSLKKCNGVVSNQLII